MKLRGKKHEILLITIITVLVSIENLFDVNGSGFFSNSQKFIELVPLWIVYLSYLWINFYLIPRVFSTESWPLRNNNNYITIIFVLAQLLFIAYLIGPICNFITFYTDSGSNLVLRGYIGSHPQPFENVKGGFFHGLIVVSTYVIYAGFREMFISKIEKKQGITDYQINSINWLTLTLVPFFAIAFFLEILEIETFKTFYLFYFLGLPSFVLVGFVNLFWLYPRFVEDKISKNKFFALLVLYPFFITFCLSIFYGSFWSISLFIGLWVIQIIIVTPFTWLIFKQKKEQILELTGARKQFFKSNADLQLLRSQINPHFLFNSLNTIYGTAIIEGSTKTAQAVQQLGDMMRFMIHENSHDFIPMAKEIEYVKNYISLQKLRTRQNNQVVIEEDISSEHCNHEIAPMLLIPFVENAFKHGVGSAEKSWVKVKLRCDEGTINFRVINSMPDTSINEDPERNNSGIGIRNVKERLSLIYNDRFTLNYGQRGGEFVVELQISITHA